MAIAILFLPQQTLREQRGFANEWGVLLLGVILTPALVKLLAVGVCSVSSIVKSLNSEIYKIGMGAKIDCGFGLLSLPMGWY
jgi:hypothetical protein